MISSIDKNLPYNKKIRNNAKPFFLLPLFENQNEGFYFYPKFIGPHNFKPSDRILISKIYYNFPGTISYSNNQLELYGIIQSKEFFKPFYNYFIHGGFLYNDEKIFTFNTDAFHTVIGTDKQCYYNIKSILEKKQSISSRFFREIGYPIWKISNGFMTVLNAFILLRRLVGDCNKTRAKLDQVILETRSTLYRVNYEKIHHENKLTNYHEGFGQTIITNNFSLFSKILQLEFFYERFNLSPLFFSHYFEPSYDDFKVYQVIRKGEFNNFILHFPNFLYRIADLYYQEFENDYDSYGKSKILYEYNKNIGYIYLYFISHIKENICEILEQLEKYCKVVDYSTNVLSTSRILFYEKDQKFENFFKILFSQYKFDISFFYFFGDLEPCFWIYDFQNFKV